MECMCGLAHVIGNTDFLKFGYWIQACHTMFQSLIARVHHTKLMLLLKSLGGGAQYTLGMRQPLYE